MARAAPAAARRLGLFPVEEAAHLLGPGDVARGASVDVDGVDAGAGGQQRPRRRRRAPAGGEVQRRLARVVGAVGVGAAAHQQPHRLARALLAHGQVQRAVAVAVARARVGAALQQQQQGLRLPRPLSKG
ncbi:hypothetical protein R5R35_008746 [Gryllus longicercus]|uniref:Uncharacterized protein n=1 Tax=Gryllus longicercus TaxID=2509291 RepID=A0AAN9Z3G3_9ORTH